MTTTESYRLTLLSTRLGTPEVIGIDARGRDIWSSIHRKRTGKPTLYLTWSGLAGDQPTMTRLKTREEGFGLLHGGPDKAVYVYPFTHYAEWEKEIDPTVLASRSFGENLSIAGADESIVRIGDELEWGEAVVAVSKAREPCQTLVEYYQGIPMMKHMYANGRCGWYFSVKQPGVVPTHGELRLIKRNPEGLTIAEAFQKKRPANF